ncbi:EthD domain-containing protein, partial [Salmonella enterica subsp. enterica serovar Corvallis]|nr:ethyl tert-butyl ether degradation protein EthD [Salmonella enterica subsp. enterica serovar Enteritidis]MBJ3286597.1 EthD domain-containing protein [Salmonella enterica subsp. enterica serovar Corvallis]
MLKLVMCVKRRAHLTREEFDHYWRNQHASLVVKHS